MSAEIEPSAPAEDAAPVAEAIRSRQRGLSLLQRANRWLIGLAVLLTGGLTAWTAHAFHARPAGAQITPASSRTARSGPSQSAAPSTPPLQPPSTAPAPAPATPAPEPAPPVVSGGS